MVAKIFIDGEAGTTGLQIRERLAGRRDLEVISIAQDKRKDQDERKRLLNLADVAILCLPDDAAKESVSLIENTPPVIEPRPASYRAGWVYACERQGPSGTQSTAPPAGKTTAAGRRAPSHVGPWSSGPRAAGTRSSQRQFRLYAEAPCRRLVAAGESATSSALADFSTSTARIRNTQGRREPR